MNTTVRRSPVLSFLRSFLRDTRGVYVEYICLVAIVALGGVVGWKTFKGSVSSKNSSQGQQVESVGN